MSRFNLFISTVIMVFMFAYSVQGQESGAAIPLEKALKPDGTLDLGKGFSGSLDPKGWQMMKGKNGEPRFVRESNPHSEGQFKLEGTTAGEDDKWEDRFGFQGFGTNAHVRAITVSGSDMYVGGGFTQAGGSAANYIAKWDGSAWTSLGGGVNGEVYAIAVSGSDVYVGGYFSTAGSVAANSIAKWNGSSWSSLGSGVNSTVQAIAISGSDVYVGGHFNHAGGDWANYIAKWNGSAWSSLGGGVEGFVNAIAVSGSDVYVGGDFTYAILASTDLVTVNHIAKWDGSTWSSLGSGVDGEVLAITVNGSDVYAGGWFISAGIVTVNHVAKWNGSAWSSLGSGVGNYYIFTIAVSGSDVYVGGYEGMAKWDGSTWSSYLGGGVNSDVNAITVSGSDVYVGGEFIHAGDINVNYIARWNGSIWSPLGSGVNHAVFALTANGSDLYAVGWFTRAGSITAYGTAKWNGGAWSSLGSGVDNYVSAIAASGSDVYVGGYFSTAGSVAANQIAKWNGSSWSALGSGVNHYVYAIAMSGSDVYAGGDFTQAGGATANYIAKWNGSAWSSLGSGVSGGDYPYVYAIAVSGSDIYVGGAFIQAGSVTANYIAKWNGSAWSSLGSGVNGEVHAITVNGSDVYVGGEFTRAGSGSANYIAKWNGSTWSSLGSGVNGNVNAITVNGSDVYVGGVFTQAGSGSANYIARWDGSTWSSLGSGLNAGVLSMAISGSGLYAGGQFTQASGKLSSYIGCWHSVIAPTFNLPAGSYASVQDVAINCGTMGATIRYTTNGNDPTESDAIYSAPIHLVSTTTLKAKAFKSGWSPSGIVSGIYKISYIAITSPNGGEVWQVESSHNITWTSTGTNGVVHIEYSTNNGSSWTDVIANTPDDGTHPWTIPNLPSNNCRVRVSDTASVPTDQSDAVFTITGLVVGSPNGGQNWHVGIKYNITWASGGTSGNVKIEYSTDSGSSWATIIASTPDDGLYLWTIPNVPSTTCLVRVSDTDGSPTDQSDAVFTISSYIVVSFPNGGENWPTGSIQDIRWNSGGTSGNVKIERTTNNGLTWSTIIASTPDDGTYSWTIPNIPSQTCRVRVTDVDGSPSDQSNAEFTISLVDFITVGSPNGGENWRIGSSHDITWTSSGTSGYVKIQYSTNNGLSWANIITSTPDNGSYTWTIPNAPSVNCLVKVMNTLLSTPSDQSDTVFTISRYMYIKIKAFLQCPYNSGTGLMNTTLKSSGILASHFGLIPIPASAVDSINIEIRDAASADGSTIRAFAPAWLLSDGNIRMFSDTTKAYVELAALTGNYYVVVHHRNHLALMSAARVVFAFDSASYDFTTAQTKAYGTNSMVLVAAQIYAIWGGDTDGSGVIDVTDRANTWNNRNASGVYVGYDTDLSGVVDVTDRANTWNNRNIQTQVPN